MTMVMVRARSETPTPDRGGSALATDGSFRLEVPPGIYTLEVESLPTRRKQAGGRVLAPARLRGVPAGTSAIRLQLEAGATISGVVVDAKGAPLARALVKTVDRATGESRQSTTGENGRFERVVPQGPSFDLEARRSWDDPFSGTTIENVAAGTSDPRLSLAP